MGEGAFTPDDNINALASYQDYHALPCTVAEYGIIMYYDHPPSGFHLLGGAGGNLPPPPPPNSQSSPPKAIHESKFFFSF